MEIEFDPDKEATNLEKHKISLARAADLSSLIVERDDRFDYGEERFRAWGVIDGNAYCLALRPAAIGFGRSVFVAHTRRR